MADPRISVLMPCWNCADTLPEALGSVLVQDMFDFEVVVVDDGSTDETGALLREAANRDSRVRPQFLPHGGIVTALNVGLAACRGAYIARMDGDDLCRSDRLRLQAMRLDEDAGLGLVSCLVDFGGQREQAEGYACYVDWLNAVTTSKEISLRRFVESPLAHPSVMFRKELVASHGGYADGPFPEDYELWLRWLGAGVRMEKLPHALLAWNDPPARLSRTCSRYDIDAFYRVKSRYLAQWLAQCNPFHPVVHVVGAGKTSRRRALLLAEYGVEIAAWADLDPKKIGNIVQGRRVVHHDELPGSRECFVLSYVGSRGAGDYVRAYLEGRGFIEGVGFLLAA